MKRIQEMIAELESLGAKVDAYVDHPCGCRETMGGELLQRCAFAYCSVADDDREDEGQGP